MDLKQLPEGVVMALTLVAMATAWCSVSLLLSVMGGWRQLAKRYTCSGTIVGTTWWFQSAGIHCYVETNYGSCLTVKANNEGIGLSLLLPFRIGHPPLFIPWSEVEIGEVRRFFFFKRVRLTFPEEPSVRIDISTRLAGKIQTAIGQNWFKEVG